PLFGGAAADQRDDLDPVAGGQPVLHVPRRRHHVAVDLDGHAAAVVAQALEQVRDRPGAGQGAGFAVDRERDHGGGPLFPGDNGWTRAGGREAALFILAGRANRGKESPRDNIGAPGEPGAVGPRRRSLTRLGAPHPYDPHRPYRSVSSCSLSPPGYTRRRTF